MKRMPLTKKIILLVVMVCAVVVGAFCVRGWLNRRRIEAAIAEFEARPCQESANVLARLIDNHRVGQGDGERILKLLFQPKVTTRSAYPVGETPMISIEHPFSNITWERSFFIWSEKIRRDKYGTQNGNMTWGSSSAQELSVFPRLIPLVGPRPESVGEYNLDIEYAFSTIKPSWWSNFRNRFRGGGLLTGYTSSYKCSFTVPVEIIVTEKADAEQIEFVSNQELDKTMAEAFSAEALDGARKFRDGQIHLLSQGGLTISWKEIPVAVAFKARVEFSKDGRNYRKSVSGVIRVRCGGSGSFEIDPRRLGFTEAGEYECTVILVPDTNIAYCDPAIKSIWNGQLRFPMSVTIKREE
jgi:hypothetical protein